MRTKLLVTAVVAVCGALLMGGVSSAANGGAETKVTIKSEGTDIFGFVKSPDPGTCAEGRLVKVFKVKRSGREKVAEDTASFNGNRYEWNTGNLGLTGRFYAKARRTADCQGDKSKTIRVQRND